MSRLAGTKGRQRLGSSFRGMKPPAWGGRLQPTQWVGPPWNVPVVPPLRLASVAVLALADDRRLEETLRADARERHVGRRQYDRALGHRSLRGPLRLLASSQELAGQHRLGVGGYIRRVPAIGVEPALSRCLLAGHIAEGRLTSHALHFAVGRTDRPGRGADDQGRQRRLARGAAAVDDEREHPPDPRGRPFGRAHTRGVLYRVSQLLRGNDPTVLGRCLDQHGVRLGRPRAQRLFGGEGSAIGGPEVCGANRSTPSTGSPWLGLIAVSSRTRRSSWPSSSPGCRWAPVVTTYRAMSSSRFVDSGSGSGVASIMRSAWPKVGSPNVASVVPVTSLPHDQTDSHRSTGSCGSSGSEYAARMTSVTTSGGSVVAADAL